LRAERSFVFRVCLKNSQSDYFMSTSRAGRICGCFADAFSATLSGNGSCP